MGLPILVCPHGTYTFEDGQTIEIRGLSRAEAIQTRSLKADDENERAMLVEIFCIAYATGVTEDEARAWHKASPSGDVEGLVDEIIRLSGFAPDVGKAVAGDLLSERLTELITSLQKLSVEPSPK